MVDKNNFIVGQIWYPMGGSYEDSGLKPSLHDDSLWQVLTINGDSLELQPWATDGVYGKPVNHEIRNTRFWSLWDDGKPLPNAWPAKQTVSQETPKLILIHLLRRPQ